MALNNALNDNLNEYDVGWFDILQNISGRVRVKLLCGADLLESFGTPGLWADQDIDEIVGQHGLIVISRENSNPQKFIYMSDVLTKYMNNIIHVTEWINNDVSSTKVRRAIRRNESVRYLIPDLVIDYIAKNDLYGSKKKSDENQMTIDTVSKTNLLNTFKHPGQAVKIITDAVGDHKVYKKEMQAENVKGNEVCESTNENKTLKMSKSCTNFERLDAKWSLQGSKSNDNLKGYKTCDENLVKFIFTKHGIQVISDVETIV